LLLSFSSVRRMLPSNSQFWQPATCAAMVVER
jgi:hypothetical protein